MQSSTLFFNKQKGAQQVTCTLTESGLPNAAVKTMFHFTPNKTCCLQA